MKWASVIAAMPQLPIPFGWLRTYSWASLPRDLMAGLTVGTMLIPQGLAYAKLASLPPIVGLYSSFVPILMYGMLGQSPHLAHGPVALVSLMVGEAVEAEAALLADAADDTDAFRLGVAALMALIAGAVLMIMGALSAGPLLNFLSHPVLAGFTSAAAIIIGASQLKHVFAVDVPSDSVPGKIVDVISRWDDINWWAVLVASLAFAALLVFKFSGRRWSQIKLVPGVVVVVIISIAIVWGARLDKESSADLKIVGVIPSGLSIAAWPSFDWDIFLRLAIKAALVALVGFLETASVGKAFANKYQYEFDANLELFAVGAANMVGAFFSSYPTVGGFSRTAVNAVAGARTQAAGLVSAVLMGATLLFLTPLFEYLPNAVLAAVILAAVTSLFEIKAAKHLWAVSKPDFVVMSVTFVATLVFGIEYGILIAVAFSLAVFVKQAAHPHAAVVGRIKGTSVWRNVNRYSGLEVTRGLRVWRMDAPLFFGNAHWFVDAVKGVVRDDGDGEALAATADSATSSTASEESDEESVSADAPRTRLPGGPVTKLVIDMSGVASIDATGIEALVEVIEWLASERVALSLAAVRGPVRDAWRNEATGLPSVFDIDEHAYLDVSSAVEDIKTLSSVSSDHTSSASASTTERSSSSISSSSSS